MKIWFVDAFAERVYAGNPAAVMVVPEFFDEVTSLKMAAEINLVETAFVKKISENHYHIRWFAPTREVKLCGHATLASAHVLWEEQLAQGDAIVFDSLSGPLHVKKSPAGLTMDFPLQPTGPNVDKQPFAAIFQHEPLAAVKAGDDLLVELDGAHLVRQLEFDVAKLLAFDCRAVIVTSVGDQGYDFVSRLFAPRIGIPEDAVSAAAHCKLVDFWRKKTGKTSFHVHQASKRGGDLNVEVVGDRVTLTGKAVTVIKGEWLITSGTAT